MWWKSSSASRLVDVPVWWKSSSVKQRSSGSLYGVLRVIRKADDASFNLKDDHEHVIMKADKGNCFVVMDKIDYVDDSLVIIKKDAVTSFHNTLYAFDPKISFTIELENNGQIAFLDTLVSRRNGVAVIDVYRKPTHTDRYLDFFSHHDIKHKISMTSIFLFRASSLPSSHEGKTREINHVRAALEANGYHRLLFLPFSIRSHPHLQFPCWKNWFLCFSNGLSHLMLTKVLHVSSTSAV